MTEEERDLNRAAYLIALTMTDRPVDGGISADPNLLAGLLSDEGRRRVLEQVASVAREHRVKTVQLELVARALEPQS